MVSARAVLGLALGLAACGDLDTAPEVRFSGEGPRCGDGRGCVTHDLRVREVAGIPVLHRPLPGSPMVAIHIGFDGGVGRWTSPVQGHAEDIMFTLTNWWGSALHDEWDGEVAALGARFGAYSSVDYASFSMTAPAVHFEASWALLADAIVWPPIPETTDALEHVKAIFLHDDETAFDAAPDAAAGGGWSLISEGHPYNILSDPESYLPGLHAEDVKSAKDELLRKSRMSVVVVGDVPTTEVERLVAKSFAQLAADGGAEFQRPPPLAPSATLAKIYDYPEAPAFHIAGYFPAPAPDETDYAALTLGLRVLSTRLYEGVRIERGLVYSIGVSTRGFRSSSGVLSLSTVEPVEAMEVTRAIIEELIASGIDDAELARERALYMTNFHENSGTAAGLASALLYWQFITAGTVTADDHLARIADVTAEEARAAVERYLANIRYGAAGPPSIPFDEAALTGEPAPEMPAF